MTPADLIEILKYAEKFENKIATVVGIILIVFLLWRKFWHSEYLTAGKQNFEELQALHDALKKDYQELKSKYELLETKVIKLQKHIENTCKINKTD